MKRLRLSRHLSFCPVARSLAIRYLYLWLIGQDQRATLDIFLSTLHPAMLAVESGASEQNQVLQHNLFNQHSKH